MNEQTSACKSRYCTPQGGGKRRRGERFDVLEVKKKGQKKRGQVKKRLKIKEMEMRKVSNRQTGRQGGVGGGCQQGLLGQCDMAHAINSGSAEGPCLAICSGSGAFERVGVTSTTAPTTTPRTQTRNPPSLQSLAWQTPDQARVHFHKTIAWQPAPCRVGGARQRNRTATSLPEQ